MANAYDFGRRWYRRCLEKQASLPLVDSLPQPAALRQYLPDPAAVQHVINNPTRLLPDRAAVQQVINDPTRLLPEPQQQRRGWFRRRPTNLLEHNKQVVTDWVTSGLGRLFRNARNAVLGNRQPLPLPRG